MDYSPDAFAALFASIERQGGAELPDPCTRGDVTFTDPPYIKNHTDPASTCGCGNKARFVSVYEPGERAANSAGYATACAVCDSMGAWPRYRPDVLRADSEAQA